MSKTYKAYVLDTDIIIAWQTSGGNMGVPLPIRSLYLNDGTHPTTPVDFEIDQQKINYLDSIKDGTNVPTMQQLNIYPLAGYGTGYPTFPGDLIKIKENIYEKRKSYLETTTWLKVKKGSVLDPPKIYSQCLWESGLGYDVFLADPKNVMTVKTFGSYIDPLEKQNAKMVWPPIGETVRLYGKFMELMGFGEDSSVEATTKSNTTFAYTMNVNCGKGCRPTKCTIAHDGTGIDPNLKYFAGNQQKKQFLTTSAGAEEKSKTIVVKEWGDKTQVLIYLIYFYMLDATTIVMITCDSVVFMLCLNLGLPCIYTGTGLINGKKSYSIVEYKPSDTPFTDVRTRLFAKIDSIQAENQSFIDSLEKLATDDGANTQISDSNKLMTFTKDFYRAILSDLNAIQVKLNEKRVKFVNEYGMLTETTGASMISAIENDIKSVRRFIIIPFLKKKSSGLTILMTKSYTLKDNIKPNIQTYLEANGIDRVEAGRDAKKSFYEIGRKYFLGPEDRKGGQRGGGLTPEQISSFPEDDDVEYHHDVTPTELDENLRAPKYTYVTNDENEEETPGPRNLLTELKSSFNQTVAIANLPEIFKDTVYTLFVYESYINGTGTCIFDKDDLTRIKKYYEETEMPPIPPPTSTATSTSSTTSSLPPVPPTNTTGRMYDYLFPDASKTNGGPVAIEVDDEYNNKLPPPPPTSNATSSSASSLPPPAPVNFYPLSKQTLTNPLSKELLPIVIEQEETYEPANKKQRAGNSLVGPNKDSWINSSGLFGFKSGFKKTVRKRKPRKTIKKRMNPKNKRTYKRR